MAKCKKRLATLWFVCSGILFFILLFQSYFGHYADNVSDAWGWLMPTILPTLSLIIGVIVSDVLGRESKVDMVDSFLFRLTFALSVGYLLTVFLTIIIEPFIQIAPIALMKQSNLWLGPFQGLVSASIGVFFVRKQNDKGAR